MAVKVGKVYCLFFPLNCFGCYVAVHCIVEVVHEAEWLNVYWGFPSNQRTSEDFFSIWQMLLYLHTACYISGGFWPNRYILLVKYAVLKTANEPNNVTKIIQEHE